MDALSPQCEGLASPGKVNFVLSILILFGILVSYLPQHIRIIRLKSSFGISPFFILLGTTANTSAFANILVLPRSIQDASCCNEISALSCFSALLGILQVGVQWLCFTTILVLFVVYFPRATSVTDPVASATVSDGRQHTYRTALIVAGVCLVHGVVVFSLSAAFAAAHPESLQSWANFLGVLSAILSSVQYFPQIYTTIRLRCAGSLSIPMMYIQTPGALIWAASLAARLGKEGWSAWGVYVVTACLQGVLLCLALYFEYIRSKTGRKETHHHGEDTAPTAADAVEAGNQPRRVSAQPSEDTPLLQSQ